MASRQEISFFDLEESVYFHRECISLKKALTADGTSGIIAEFKRKSPSKGVISESPSLEKIAKGYQDGGAAALSILTDQEFFGGNGEDLVEARELVKIPILRKEFVVEAYQITEAKAMGADAVLLIAAILTPYEVMRFAGIAESLGMECLLEVHNEKELDACLSMDPHVQLIGVNNRNLKDFSVNQETSIKLASKIPDQYVKIAESGISDPEGVKRLKDAGFQGFLIGEHFMKDDHPGKACQAFITEVEKLSSQLTS